MLFGRDDFGRAAGGEWEEAFWLLGEPAVLRRQELDAPGAAAAEPGSRRFADGGLCFLRGGGSYVAVDAGPVGQGGVGGHAHGDALGFEFAAGGRPWVLDPGTGAYTGDFALRNRLRSSRAHPVLVIDGEETDRFDERELFAMRDDARPVIERWESAEERDLLVARHHGYERLAPPVSVRRTFRLDRRTGALLVMDEAAGAGRHAFACRLPFAVDTAIEVAGRVARVRGAGAAERLAVCVAPEGCEAELAVATGPASPGYGIVRAAPALEIAGTLRGPDAALHPPRPRHGSAAHAGGRARRPGRAHGRALPPGGRRPGPVTWARGACGRIDRRTFDPPRVPNGHFPRSRSLPHGPGASVMSHRHR